jgi:AcrR family transcriptional regulator
MPEKKSKDRAPYHHGDLRRVIIETAQTMLGEDQGWHFTLREVARRAGVSHAAPYKHFPDKACLLAELAMIGFDQLRESLTTAVGERSQSARNELLIAATAYVQFGVDHPSLYRLMFSAEVNQAAGVHKGERALGALAILLDLLERGQKEGVFRQRPFLSQAAACWAQVHGLTLLALDGLLIPEKVGATPIEDALSTLLEGVAIP